MSLATEGRVVVTGAWGGGTGLVLHRYGVSVQKVIQQCECAQ